MIYTVTLNPAIDETLEVEMLRPGGTHRILSRRRYPGGKGINTARALRVFAEDCVALTAAGGPTGQELAALLRQEELPCTVFAAPHPTRVNLKILSKKDGLTTELNAVGALGDAGCAERLKTELLERLLPGDTVVFCGSLPQDVPAGWYRECITACREKGAAVFLDASGEPLILGISAKPDCIKPNREELELLYGYRLQRPEVLGHGLRNLFGDGLHGFIGEIPALHRFGCIFKVGTANFVLALRVHGVFDGKSSAHVGLVFLVGSSDRLAEFSERDSVFNADCLLFHGGSPSVEHAHDVSPGAIVRAHSDTRWA